MKILFVKGSSPLSSAICGVTGEPVSHVALEFPELGIVVHSNLLGVNIEWSSFFRKNCSVVYELSARKSDMTSDKAKLGTMLDKYEGSWYDFGALLFMGLILCTRNYLKLPLPKSNLWQTSGMFECTEWVTEYISAEEDSMITPYKLYLKLKNTGAWGEHGEETNAS